MHESMELVFLGTGGSWPSVARNVPAIAVKRGAEIILFDCGEGTQRQFQKSKLSYMQVSRVFITHLHADHFLGVPGLVMTMRLNEREEPLDIYGPPGTKRLMDTLLSIGKSRAGFRVNVHELDDGDEVDFGAFSVRARAVVHSTFALGYRLQEKDRPGRFNKPRALELGVPEGRLFGKLQRGESVVTPEGRTVTPEEVLGRTRRGRRIAYTGDCVPSESVIELAEGADVLIHDSTYANDFPDANRHGHSTAAQAAFMARKSGARRLYLTHVSPRYTDASPLLEEARKVFSESYEARDFTEFVVRFPPEEDEDAPQAAGTA